MRIRPTHILHPRHSAYAGHSGEKLTGDDDDEEEAAAEEAVFTRGTITTEEEAVFIRDVNTNEDSPNAQHAPHRSVRWR